MAKVTIDNIVKTFGTTEVLKNINLEIKDGEFFILLGPSGCGKTTLLRIIAGLSEQSGGRLIIGDKDVSELSPRERNIAMVFQDYALYPHMTVEGNISFPLKMAKMRADEIKKRVAAITQLLRIGDFLNKKPKELSGGQRQRVAIGRALVRSPNVLLMDEPLSNLDAKLRTTMRFEIKRIQRETGITVIYVTHDQVEAMTMGDRIAILNEGVVKQCGTPFDIFHKPVDSFVATFTGSPPMNILDTPYVRKQLGIKDDVLVGVRPRAVSLSPAGGGAIIEAKHIGTDLLGNELLVHTTVADDDFIFLTSINERDAIVDNLKLYIRQENIYLFERATGSAIKFGQAE